MVYDIQSVSDSVTVTVVRAAHLNALDYLLIAAGIAAAGIILVKLWKRKNQHHDASAYSPYRSLP